MEGESCYLEKNANEQSSDLVHDGRPILQSVRVRHRSVPVNSVNWQSVERELRFVLYCGSILWALYLLSLAL